MRRGTYRQNERRVRGSRALTAVRRGRIRRGAYRALSLWAREHAPHLLQQLPPSDVLFGAVAEGAKPEC
jgi:hypothetical protein